MNRDIAEIVYGALQPIEERLSALESEGAVVPLLDKIAGHLNMLALAAMQQSGMIQVDFDDNDNFVTRIVTPEEREMRDAPTPRVVPGRTSTLHGDGGPLQWVLYPPAPYNDVEIVCSPDGETEIGMRCHVVKKVIGGERQTWNLTPEEA